MKIFPPPKLSFKVVKRLILFFLVFYIGTVLLTPHLSFLRNRSIENQIEYLSELLNSGYDDELQQRFPEGKMFSNALLGLSIIEYSDHNKINDSRYAQQVDSCILRMLSKKAKEPFPSNISPQFGMFYNGWTQLVLTKYMDSQLFNHSSIQAQILSSSDEIHRRIVDAQMDSIHPLPSYHGSYWPADNFIGLITVKDSVLKFNWMRMMDTISQHSSGLIHHAGNNSYSVRGSSSAMITYCLAEIDREKAISHNSKFNGLLVQPFLGANLVKEHEDGSGVEDVDSGPLLFGYGASATLMNIKAQAVLGAPGARATWGWMNLIGVPVNIWNQKYYIFKQEPMFDLFMLWSSVSL